MYSYSGVVGSANHIFLQSIRVPIYLVSNVAKSTAKMTAKQDKIWPGTAAHKIVFNMGPDIKTLQYKVKHAQTIGLKVRKTPDL